MHEFSPRVSRLFSECHMFAVSFPLLHLLMSSVAEHSSFYITMNTAHTQTDHLFMPVFGPPGPIFALDQIFVIGLGLFTNKGISTLCSKFTI